MSANIADQCKREVTEDPGSGHHITITITQLKTKKNNPQKRVMWNFKKSDWKSYRKKWMH